MSTMEEIMSLQPYSDPGITDSNGAICALAAGYAKCVYVDEKLHGHCTSSTTMQFQHRRAGDMQRCFTIPFPLENVASVSLSADFRGNRFDFFTIASPDSKTIPFMDAEEHCYPVIRQAYHEFIITIEFTNAEFCNRIRNSQLAYITVGGIYLDTIFRRTLAQCELVPMRLNHSDWYIEPVQDCAEGAFVNRNTGQCIKFCPIRN